MGKKPAKQSTKAAASSKGAATSKAAAAASSKGAAVKTKVRNPLSHAVSSRHLSFNFTALQPDHHKRYM
jgi:hypothetical protein